MSKNITSLKRINIQKFRGLKDVNIEFGERITIISGKNGTSKSTILGIIAQAFSFRKDYSKTPNVDLSSHKTLTDAQFESRFSDHFRLSEQYDKPGSMDIDIAVYDGAEKKLLDLTLGLYAYQDRPKPRPIIRGNTTTNSGSSSRNVTHPLIYLSLKRLMPIAFRSAYSEHNVKYLADNKSDFRLMNNKLLNKNNVSEMTATTGTISSVVVHGKTYDHESVSAGEDNVGQILQALFSFRKLKSEYDDYRGGILLIDEADAGLFPAAQVEFIKILAREAKNLDLQIIMTSHSPTMIGAVYELGENAPQVYKTVYLTDTFGDISVRENVSWTEIYADLHVETIKADGALMLPKINVYFEDGEAYDMFSAIVTEQRIKKPLNCLKEATLGCQNYKQLIQKKIPEFNKKSIIIFDADVDGVDAYKNVIRLPGQLPPDQLLFAFLYQLPPGDDFWKNKRRFTKSVFFRIASDIIERLNINAGDGVDFDIQALLINARNLPAAEFGVIREKFKKFYKTDELQLMIKGPVKDNPFRLWVSQNRAVVDKFKSDFVAALKHTLIKGNGVEAAKVDGYLELDA
jgi:AAA15 family ATPase/GTPase